MTVDCLSIIPIGTTYTTTERPLWKKKLKNNLAIKLWEPWKNYKASPFFFYLIPLLRLWLLREYHHLSKSNCLWNLIWIDLEYIKNNQIILKTLTPLSKTLLSCPLSTVNVCPTYYLMQKLKYNILYNAIGKNYMLYHI